MNVLIHSLGVANFGYALYYDLTFVHLPPHLKGKKGFESMSAFPGKWKYLTIWNMVLQLVYHIIALANDLSGTSELNPKRQCAMQKIRDHVFAGWAFPSGVFVSVVFWAVYSYDRELVFPKIMDSFFPEWLNQSVHSGPLLFVIFEQIFVPIIYPKPVIGPVLVVGGISTYLSWSLWINHVSGVWAYPLLQILNNAQRAAFFGGCAIAILICYFFGEMLNKWRWGKAQEGKASSGKAGKSVKGKRKTK